MGTACDFGSVLNAEKLATAYNIISESKCARKEETDLEKLL